MSCIAFRRETTSGFPWLRDALLLAASLPVKDRKGPQVHKALPARKDPQVQPGLKDSQVRKYSKATSDPKGYRVIPARKDQQASPARPVKMAHRDRKAPPERKAPPAKMVRQARKVLSARKDPLARKVFPDLKAPLARMAPQARKDYPAR